MPVRVYMFDAYGTLFDVHAAIRRVGAPLGADATAISQLWRMKQLEYTWTRTLMGRVQDFWALTQQALDFALAAFGINDPALRESLLACYRTLDAYPDVAPALTSLKARGLTTAIFTNGTPGMIDEAIAAAELSGLIDHVVTVEPTGRYKPDMTVYEHASRSVSADPAEIVFVSSNRWDVAGAQVFGFVPLWCNRSGQPGEYADAPPLVSIPNLEGLGAVRV